MKKRIAVSRLHLSDGSILRNQVVEVNSHRRILSYADLTEELPCTCWQGGNAFVHNGSLVFTGEPGAEQ